MRRVQYSPNDFKVDVEVAVDQPVSGARELPPGDARQTGLNWFRYMAGSFADDFKQPDNGKRKHLVRLQVSPCPILHESSGRACGIQHVLKPDAINLKDIGHQPSSPPRDGNMDSGKQACASRPRAVAVSKAPPASQRTPGRAHDLLQTRQVHPRRCPAGSHRAIPSQIAPACGSRGGGRSQRWHPVARGSWILPMSFDVALESLSHLCLETLAEKQRGLRTTYPVAVAPLCLSCYMSRQGLEP